MVNRVVYLAGLGSVAYRSFKQLRVAPADRDADSSRALLEQWTVLALLHSYQEFAEPLFSWLPLYSVVKLFLLAWVMVPQAEGSRWKTTVLSFSKSFDLCIRVSIFV